MYFKNSNIIFCILKIQISIHFFHLLFLRSKKKQTSTLTTQKVDVIS